MMTELITTEVVLVDVEAPDRVALIRLIGERLLAAGRVSDLEGFLQDVATREAQMPTGLPGGVGIPHARSAHVTASTLGFARVSGGVDFGAEDGPADLVFLVAVPAEGDQQHLKILAALARRLVHPSFRAALRSAPGAEEITRILSREVSVA